MASQAGRKGTELLKQQGIQFTSSTFQAATPEHSYLKHLALQVMSPSACTPPLTSHHSSYCLIGLTGACSRILDSKQPPMPGTNHPQQEDTRYKAQVPSLSAPSAFLHQKCEKHQKAIPKRVMGHIRGLLKAVWLKYSQ